MSQRGAAEPTIRLFCDADIAFAVEQTSREGWDSTAETFALHMAHDPDGCFIAEIEGQRVGMVTTTRYRATGWIGNLIVLPGQRGTGLGTRLMEHAIRHLEGKGLATIRLEADPMGIRIYRRLGFRDEFDSPRFRREPGASLGARDGVAPAVSNFGALAAFDAPHFGDDRANLLRLLMPGALAAFRVPRGGELGGYLVVQPSAAGARIGPWVASDARLARQLLETTLAAFSDRALIVAVPGPNAGCRDLLASHGFLETPSSLRMVRGSAVGAGRPENVYALANGAVG